MSLVSAFLRTYPRDPWAGSGCMDPGMYVLVPPPWVTGTVSSGRSSSNISCSAVFPLFQLFLKLFLCLSLMSGTQSQGGLSLWAWLEGRVGVWDAPYPLPTLGRPQWRGLLPVPSPPPCPGQTCLRPAAGPWASPCPSLSPCPAL